MVVCILKVIRAVCARQRSTGSREIDASIISYDDRARSTHRHYSSCGIPNKTPERRRNHVKSFLSFSAKRFHVSFWLLYVSFCLSLFLSFFLLIVILLFCLSCPLLSLLILALIHHFGFLYILPTFR